MCQYSVNPIIINNLSCINITIHGLKYEKPSEEGRLQDGILGLKGFLLPNDPIMARIPVPKKTQVEGSGVAKVRFDRPT